MSTPHKPVTLLWVEADRWLRHWQQTGGIGRPHDWAPLAFEAGNHAEMIARIGQAGGTFSGTEQHCDMQALAAALTASAPAPEVSNRGSEALEDRLRVLAEACGESYEQLLHYATQFAEGNALTDVEVTRLEHSWAAHRESVEARKAAASGDTPDAPPVVEDVEEPGAPG